MSRFLDAIESLEGCAEELDAAMAELVKTVRERASVGKPGVLTLKLRLDPPSDDVPEFVLSYEVNGKMPPPHRTVSFVRPNARGELAFANEFPEVAEARAELRKAGA